MVLSVNACSMASEFELLLALEPVSVDGVVINACNIEKLLSKLLPLLSEFPNASISGSPEEELSVAFNICKKGSLLLEFVVPFRACINGSVESVLSVLSID